MSPDATFSSPQTAPTLVAKPCQADFALSPLEDDHYPGMGIPVILPGG